MVHLKMITDHLQFPFRIPWAFHIRQGTGAVSTAPPEASWAPVLKNKNTGNSLGFSRNIAETNETKKHFLFWGGRTKFTVAAKWNFTSKSRSVFTGKPTRPIFSVKERWLRGDIEAAKSIARKNWIYKEDLKRQQNQQCVKTLYPW